MSATGVSLAAASPRGAAWQSLASGDLDVVTGTVPRVTRHLVSPIY